MPGWALVNTHPTRGRTFERPLDHAEVAFMWDARIKGTTDIGRYFQLRLMKGSTDAHLFSKANIIRSWLSLKRRFPLAGATIRGPKMKRGDGGSDPNSGLEAYFIVRECDLAVVRPGEIIFGQVAGAEEMQHKVATILDGSRALAEDLLMQLHIFHENDPQRADILYVVMLMVHSIADGIGINTVGRCFLDTLARGELGSEPPHIPLEERLAMVVPSAERLPKQLRSFSMARRRWRIAIGHVVYQLMRKNLGGHTIPCRITPSTPITPARTGYISISFTNAETASVLANCRLHNLTFGTAYLPLAQVAMTRVLYRRYLRGEISEEEWEYRRRQPHLSVGPLNLRPRLDKDWFERGGGGELVLSVSSFLYRLPFMTLGTERYNQSRPLSDGAPPLQDLLTFDRFLYRAGLVKKQAMMFLRHPLFFEVVEVGGMVRARRALPGALRWMGNKDKASNEDEEALAVTDLPVTIAHGGASLGDVDVVSPTEYPLPSTHPLSPHTSTSHPARAGYVNPPMQSPPNVKVTTTPNIVVENGPIECCMRPGELYLGASSSRGRMKMSVHYDRNVFEDGVVKEWLDEVKAAVLWYLGRTHPSRHSRRSRANGRAHLGGGVSAKL